MLTWIRQLLAAPVFEDEETMRAASLLNTILLSVLAIAVMASIITPFISTTPLRGLVATATTVLLALGTLFLMRRGRVRLASGLFLFALWGLDTLLIFASSGMRSPIPPGYIVVTIMAGLLLGGRAAMAFAGLSVVAGLGMLYAESLGFLPSPLIPFTSAAGWTSLTANLILAAALLYLATRRISEALERARHYAAELEEQREHLEETIEERTQDLTRRTRYLEATAEVAREAASLLDPEELPVRAVALITERLGLHRMGIFLLDQASEWAVLRAVSGEGAQRLLARGFRLRVQGEGIVAHVIRTGRPYVASDVREDPLYLDDPDVTDTRSEITLPLQARGEIIGTLSAQSAEPYAFGDEDVSVMQALADQVAMAISNARLFQQAQESLEAERRAYGELSRQAWSELLRTRPDLGFLSDERGTFPAGDLWEPQMEAALRRGETALGDGDGTTLAMPIKVRGQVIGVIDAHKSDGAGKWTAEEAALMETLTEQLGVALESARLYQDTQRRAARERLTSQVTARVRESLDMETVLKTAVQEVRQALGLPEVVIRLTTSPPSPRTTGDGRSGNEPARSDSQERIV
jgi:GAF domain-containing protein